MARRRTRITGRVGGTCRKAGVEVRIAAVVAGQAADGSLGGGGIDAGAESERSEGGKREGFQLHGTRSLLSWDGPEPAGFGTAESALSHRYRPARSYARIQGASAMAVALRRITRESNQAAKRRLE